MAWRMSRVMEIRVNGIWFSSLEGLVRIKKNGQPPAHCGEAPKRAQETGFGRFWPRRAA